MKADLHVHSTVSDGSDDIGSLIAMAKQKGLDAIALTEHDTLSHTEQIPYQTKIQVISGIELSAVHRKTGTRAHVLGYHIQKPEIITTLTQPLLQERNRNSENQAEVLIRLGYRIDVDKLARADGKYLYKQHIMDWLVTTGQAPDMFGDFYKQTFKNGGPCAFDIEYLDVFDAITAVKEAGGLAVLAHPGQQMSLWWLMSAFVHAGLCGLELNHHSNTAKDMEIIRDAAKEYGLFLTGGSDYHGKYEPQPFGIGDFLSEESGWKAIC